MKANELMIGDWANFPIGYEKIQEISYQQEIGGYCVWFAASATLFPCKIEDIEPIPLTPDILKKNGFEYNLDRGVYMLGIIFQVKPERNGMFSISICGCPQLINTVHKLQHALKLCEIEKKY